MTKTLPILVLLSLVAATPGVLAHGAPTAREIDTRVLEEGLDLLLDYGSANGLYEDAAGRDVEPLPILYEGGHDLLTLDLREAYGPDGEGGEAPGLWTRHTFRRGASDVTITDVISFTVDGTAIDLEMTSPDNAVFTSETFTFVSEKIEEGGYEWGLYGFVPYTRIGVAPGQTLADISVTSFVDDSPTDVMPGSYYYQGEMMPYGGDALSGVPSAGAPAYPGEYVLAGPAPLIDVVATVTTLDLADAAARYEITLTLSHPLQATMQDITAEVAAPLGLDATLSSDELRLDPETPTTEVVLTVEDNGLAEDGLVTVAFRTDVGGYASFDLPVTAPPPIPLNLTSPDVEPLDHGEDHSEDAPGIGLFALLGAIVAAVQVARRR